MDREDSVAASRDQDARPQPAANASAQPSGAAYLEDGRKIEIVSAVPGGGYIVRHVYEEDDWGADYGEPAMVRAIWKEPPVAVYEAKVGEVMAALEKASGELRAKRAERLEFDRAESRIRDNLRKHGLLEGIEAALEGRLTHAVKDDEWDGNISIVTIADAIKDGSSSWRLNPLTLEGSISTKGVSFTWKADRSSLNVFTSEEGALAAARALLAGRLMAATRHSHQVPGLLRSCTALGVEQPSGLVESHRESEVKRWREAIAKSERETAIYRTYLAKIEKPATEDGSHPAGEPREDAQRRATPDLPQGDA